MNHQERRLVLDLAFDEAIHIVLGAFVLEGFAVDPVDAGDLHRPAACGDRLRYASLRASLPELGMNVRPDWPPLECRLCLFELVGDCTLVTVKSPADDHSQLTSTRPRIAARIGDALRLLTRAVSHAPTAA